MITYGDTLTYIVKGNKPIYKIKYDFNYTTDGKGKTVEINKKIRLRR